MKFHIIGFEKSGTTSLAYYLRHLGHEKKGNHPEITPKEIRKIHYLLKNTTPVFRERSELSEEIYKRSRI